MPGLNLFTGNRLEILAEKLAELLSKPLGSPLQKEIILVQSKGMERGFPWNWPGITGSAPTAGVPYSLQMGIV